MSAVTTYPSVLVFTALLSATAGASQVRYRAILLEPLDGGGVIAAESINASGVISGTAGTSQVDPGQHAVIWGAGQIENLDPFFDISSGRFINDAGVVAGIGWLCPPVNGPCVGLFARALPGGEFLPIGDLGGNPGEVADMNASGAFVGYGHDEQHMTRAFLFTEAGGLQNLGTLGGFASGATGLNDAGTVVGWSYTGNLQLHAFTWQDKVMLDLETLGGSASAALDINGAGVIVGWADGPGGQPLAFRTVGGTTLESIQTLAQAESSRATVVNDAGVIGGLWSDGISQRLFVFSEGSGMVDVGVPDVSGFDPALGPAAISTEGVMVGTGFTELYAAVPWFWSPQAGLRLLNELIVNGNLIAVSGVSAINDSGQIAVSGHDPLTFHARAALLEPVAAADVNADGAVNVADLVLLIAAWGPCPEGQDCPADISGDQLVNVADLVALITSWS